ncbi:DUF6468 domain-containing protein [Sneathiella sp.]|uniref:DUF6468 domain-containing protein n=1 Tax=Sneathiella sp. TaxID=1964365 RepID=UPI00356A97CE
MIDNIPFDFVMNLFLVGLLLATIGYCALLNKRLSAMRDAHEELRHLSEEFDKAIVRSKLGVEELKGVAETTGRKFQEEIHQARELVEELQLINASSTRIADRLQKNVETSAKKDFPDVHEDDPVGLFEGNQDDAKAAAPTAPKKFRTDAEKELFDMLTKTS